MSNQSEKTPMELIADTREAEKQQGDKKKKVLYGFDLLDILYLQLQVSLPVESNRMILAGYTTPRRL
ncbi:hypothetical protein KTH_55820 [Thermosporothrix hazakensis]|nr:hypothetical protein KTH_55820 [Thermosporothrix hazakensis]